MQKTLPASHDWRPENLDQVNNRLESLFHGLVGGCRKLLSNRQQLKSQVKEIEVLGQDYQRLTDEALQQCVLEIRQALTAKGFQSQNVVACFALVRELSTRILGMRHYPSQLEGGLVLLRGMVAEMETGEGKTLTATLTASAAALAGFPVHVISVNDYLTARDAENMRPLYEALGLRVGCVVHERTPPERRQAYQCDITYVTNKELVFDYLRDRLTLDDRLDPLLLQAESLHGTQMRSKKLLLRGLHFAIVDEADSVLIDEARTPLIISGREGNEDEKQFLHQALALAESLQEGEDFVLDKVRRQLFLTEAGRQRIEQETNVLGPLWSGMVRRESTVHQALNALHFFHLDEHYLLRDEKIQIVDEFTGRVMADRSWEKGLHQMIELKENCELTQRREPLAKISYQRFFRRYLHLAGMTGTAKEVAGELWSVYRLFTRRVPTHKPVIRKPLNGQMLATEQQKWLAVVERMKALHKQNRPILVGTRSVALSEKLSTLARQAGLECQVLNAKQDAEEAGVVGRAGQPGCITIATNMAGRGTDICLGKGVCETGGLHVIITERHEAARIDRQLAGRCGRQGDPGSYEFILSLDDPLLEINFFL